MKRHAFTLIELMATVALAGVLMLALLQVITATGRTQRMMASTPVSSVDPWQRAVAVIERDLQSARSATFHDGVLVLEGVGGWDPSTLEPNHEPAVVRYRRIDAEPPLLVREQRDVLRLGQQRPWRVLIGVGVERFTLEPIVPQDAPGGSGNDSELRMVLQTSSGRYTLPVESGLVRLGEGGPAS